jgi:exodeoxyribonuclease-5
VCILRGAAGTGKTTLLRALVGVLADAERTVVLLAPTGRAAKVLSARTGADAATVHKHIYAAETGRDGGVRFRLRANDDPHGTWYVVDEASMLSDQYDATGAMGTRLLSDLIEFVLGGEETNRLVFIGDGAQLPPVGSEDSPALRPKYLQQRYALEPRLVDLTEVKRQALESGILLNATQLRAHLRAPEATDAAAALPPLLARPDLQSVEDYHELAELFYQAYDTNRPEAAVLLTGSNRTAVALNQAVRALIWGHDPPALAAGDLVLVVKNYYSRRFQSLPFIANGDLGRVVAVWDETHETRYGLEWVKAEVEFLDVNGKAEAIQTLIPVTLLTSGEAALSSEKSRELWIQRKQDRAEEGLPVKTSDLQADDYLSALQLKFGYALTVHKAQGGQWDRVIVAFEPWLVDRQIQESKRTFLRWAYTAMTRAAHELYLYRSPFPWGG